MYMRLEDDVQTDSNQRSSPEANAEMVVDLLHEVAWVQAE
jgi:hypothetical protein